MLLGNQFAYGARVIAVIVSLLPLYLTITAMRDAPFLSQAGREVISHPISIALIAYGTGYAALGDATTTLNSMFAVVIAICYMFVVRPDIGDKYFDTKYIKDYMATKKK